MELTEVVDKMVKNNFFSKDSFAELIEDILVHEKYIPDIGEFCDYWEI